MEGSLGCAVEPTGIPLTVQANQEDWEGELCERLPCHPP